MKLLIVMMLVGSGFTIAQEVKDPVKNAANNKKSGLVFQGKAYYLGDDITEGKTIILNRYYREGAGPEKPGIHMSQRFILTKDDAKTVAEKMSESFKKRGKVTLVDNVAPNVTGMLITEAGETISFVTISIYEKASNGKGVSVKTYEIVAPKMPAEKLEGIVAKFQKKTLTDLVNTKFPKIVFGAPH